MMDDLAETVADSDVSLDDAEDLLERWEGRPDIVMEDILRVRDLNTKEVIDLDLTPYQKQFVHAVWYGDASTTAVLKGRRTGYSFIACCTILVYCLTHPYAFVAITGPSKSQAEDRIDDLYDLIDWWKLDLEKEDLATDNVDEIEFPNGAGIMAFSGDPDTSRGADSADILFIDEMAFLEDEQESMRGFGPFTALGETETMQISTPNTSNDLFMDDMERGSPTGDNGIISIEQPSFHDADDIDAEESLFEQDVEPVNPYQSVEEAEKARARDPQGFEQEYLCRTVEDSYRFFSKQAIYRAQRRGAARVDENGDLIGRETDDETGAYWHPATHARCGGQMIMGVDIGTDGNDDTALAVFEHANGHRYLRFHTVLDRQDMDAVGLSGENPEDPTAVARYIHAVVENMGVDHVFLDKTGPGYGFQKAVEKRIGRKAHEFNFSDTEEVERMFGDFNFALHKDAITLVPDELMRKQLEAIIKEQRRESSTPHFSGKDNAPDGKDDLAMALVMGAFPPNFDADREDSLQQRENVSEANEPDEAGEGEPGKFRGVVQTTGASKSPHQRGQQSKEIRVNRGPRVDHRYDGRHDRDNGRR